MQSFAHVCARTLFSATRAQVLTQHEFASPRVCAHAHTQLMHNDRWMFVFACTHTHAWKLHEGCAEALHGTTHAHSRFQIYVRARARKHRSPPRHRTESGRRVCPEFSRSAHTDARSLARTLTQARARTTKIHTRPLRRKDHCGAVCQLDHWSESRLRLLRRGRLLFVLCCLDQERG